jgi:hypothetical protein
MCSRYILVLNLGWACVIARTLLILFITHTNDNCFFTFFGGNSAFTITPPFLIGGFVSIQAVKTGLLTLFQNSYWPCLIVLSRQLQQFTWFIFAAFFFYSNSHHKSKYLKYKSYCNSAICFSSLNGSLQTLSCSKMS